MLVEDTKHPRVQAHAAAAMVNFCEECPPKILEPYLDGLVDALENVLTSKMQEVILFIIYVHDLQSHTIVPTLTCFFPSGFFLYRRNTSGDKWVKKLPSVTAMMKNANSLLCWKFKSVNRSENYISYY